MLCLCVSPSTLTFECLNQYLWNLVCTSWQLNSSLCGVLHKSLPTVCVSFLSLQDNGSVNTFLWQRIHTAIEESLNASFYVRSVSYHRVWGSVCVTTPRQRGCYVRIVTARVQLKKSLVFILKGFGTEMNWWAVNCQSWSNFDFDFV
jgi:hypothetical protein